MSFFHFFFFVYIFFLLKVLKAYSVSASEANAQMERTAFVPFVQKLVIYDTSEILLAVTLTEHNIRGGSIQVWRRGLALLDIRGPCQCISLSSGVVSELPAVRMGQVQGSGIHGLQRSHLSGCM